MGSNPLALLALAAAPEARCADLEAAMRAALRRELKPYPAKVLARAVPASPKTTAKWKAGEEWPCARHLWRLVDLFGAGFLEAVFAPVLSAREEDLATRLERIEREARAIRLEVIHELEREGRKAAAAHGFGLGSREAGAPGAPAGGASLGALHRRAAAAAPAVLGVLLTLHLALAGVVGDLRTPRGPTVRGGVERVLGGSARFAGRLNRMAREYA